MPQRKLMALFSGGKDSIFSIQQILKVEPIVFLVSTHSSEGDTQLTDGLEINSKIRHTQIELIGLPFKEIPLSNGHDYLDKLLKDLDKLIKSEKITHVVTGDLWHPDGIGKIIATRLGVTLLSPAAEICKTKEMSATYVEKVIQSDIEAVITGVRDRSVPAEFLGRKIDQNLIKEFEDLKIDVAGEDGEYQSLVLSAPCMSKRIMIDSFIFEKVKGKNTEEIYTRMNIKTFHAMD